MLHKLNEKGKKIGRALGRYLISLYSTGILLVAKIKVTAKSGHKGPNGCVFVCYFGKFCAPVLVSAHTVNNLDLNHDQIF